MITLVELQAFFAKHFPETGAEVESIGEGRARVRQTILPRHLRPGATVSGPVLMAVADQAMYAALLATIGWVPEAATAHLAIDFLRRPPADRAIVGDAELVKVGRRLAVGLVRIRSDGNEDLVAHATVTYAIPTRSSAFAGSPTEPRA